MCSWYIVFSLIYLIYHSLYYTTITKLMHINNILSLKKLKSGRKIVNSLALIIHSGTTVLEYTTLLLMYL